MQDLRKAILGDPLVRKVLTLSAPGEVFLVGGYIRDLLRGVKSRDIDFVVRGGLKDVFPKLLSNVGGTVVEFREFLMVRAVVRGYTLDFTELKGELDEDLSLRDFTMNAIAWSAEKGLIDPLGGREDIRKGIVRAVREKNFVDDPLRLIRAYRFAGELGWGIERETRRTIRKLKGLIRKSASERITLEIFRLLNSYDHLRALKEAFADGLISEIIACKTGQLRHNIKAISRLDSFLKKIPEEWEARLDGPFSQGLCYAGLLRAEQLLYGDVGSKLTLGRAILNRLRAVSELLARFEKDRTLDDPMIFDLFSTAGEAVVDFALLIRSRRALKKAVRFLGSSPVLTTAKLMRISGVPPGPELGSLLRDMKRMQFLGKINNEKDALKWLRVRGACGLRVHETGMRKGESK